METNLISKISTTIITKIRTKEISNMIIGTTTRTTTEEITKITTTIKAGIITTCKRKESSIIMKNTMIINMSSSRKSLPTIKKDTTRMIMIKTKSIKLTLLQIIVVVIKNTRNIIVKKMK